MLNKLYVGNLSYKATERELKNLFQRIGPVTSVKIIKDRDTKRSKGFGFVEMESDIDAQTAMAQLNEQQFKGRPVKISVAKRIKETFL